MRRKEGGNLGDDDNDNDDNDRQVRIKARIRTKAYKGINPCGTTALFRWWCGRRLRAAVSDGALSLCEICC